MNHWSPVVGAEQASGHYLMRLRRQDDDDRKWAWACSCRQLESHGVAKDKAAAHAAFAEHLKEVK